MAGSVKELKKVKYPAAVIFLLFLILVGIRSVSAAGTGGHFVTRGGKGYYMYDDGSVHTGWLYLTVNGEVRRYYFDANGAQTLGWASNHLRYFHNSAGEKGYMATGFLKNKDGQLRYFRPTDGIMCRGWTTIDGGTRYFSTANGIMYRGSRKVGSSYYYFSTSTSFKNDGIRQEDKIQRVGTSLYYYDADGKRFTNGWFHTNNRTFYATSTGALYVSTLKKIGSYHYLFFSDGSICKNSWKQWGGYTYFFNTQGRAQMNWLTYEGKKYFFDQNGHLLINTTFTYGTSRYQADENGVVTKVPSKYKYEVKSGYVLAYDNDRTYYLASQFATDPGVADGSKSDLDLLAAIAECEAGDQGEIGMEAVCLCILNRTIKPDKEFPSEVRYVIYQKQYSYGYAQYSPVDHAGAMTSRLNGYFINRTAAYSAAQKALDLFNSYKINKTPRYLPGFDRQDFNFMYFMAPSSFWGASNLNFSKVDYFVYKDHLFFVDWIL